ncbi:SARP family transcriptional regulator [Frankia sp. CNm7]|nr:SARP family transcriptional regulator [Frankia nepalensis]MBL7510186.1 SARP family transcriptional regulator [Frankia nepalensis]MBL7518556.1 SARP family transcriptional regulator [Frankia nepalensis]
MSVHLLGAPYVMCGPDRQPAPRGRKTWALLAYLLATDSTPSREWLAELLFSDADDPLNALSWNLSQLRRLLGVSATVGGDPVELRLPPGTFIDVRALRTGTWMQALDLPGLRRQFLEGMSFPSSPAFEVWLLAERRHLAGVADDVLREAARARLATGDARRAVELVSGLVASRPLDEDAQELLIRSYVRAGDRGAAAQQRDACVALFQKELGRLPVEAVLRAADVEPPPDPPTRMASEVGIKARLEAGLAAMDAGAIDSGVASLRQAAADAHETGEPELEARTLVTLGSALIRGVRGRDGEGAEILHRAVAAAERAAAPTYAAQAHRELGYVELLRARYDRASRWLGKAASLAADDPAELAWARAIQGLVLADIGRHSDGQRELRDAVRLARQARVPTAETWALTFVGRSHLLRHELADARAVLREALAAAHRARWTAFVPLPESLLAEVDLMEGHVDEAAAAFEHAYALGSQFGDPCWEGISARGLGLVADRRGDLEAALRWVAEGRARCARQPDAWLWIEGYCLDTLCALASRHPARLAGPWIADLEALATRTGMRELVARAYLHRGRNGDRDAAEAARVLAAEVDNPAVLTVERPPFV